MHEKIPPQQTGAKSDTISEIELDSVQLAKTQLLGAFCRYRKGGIFSS